MLSKATGKLKHAAFFFIMLSKAIGKLQYAEADQK